MRLIKRISRSFWQRNVFWPSCGLYTVNISYSSSIKCMREQYEKLTDECQIRIYFENKCAFKHYNCT